MFEVTETAATNLKAYFEQNNLDSPVRVGLMQGGCSGAALGLALDEPGENDRVFEDKALKFVIAEDLLSQCGAVKVDFIEAGYRSGFSITSTNPVGGGGCGSCSGSCG